MSLQDVPELRRPFLIHAGLVVAAWLTYLFDRDDVILRLIRNCSHPRLPEHIAFGSAAAAVGFGILLGSWRTDMDFTAAGWSPSAIRRRSLGEILHGLGIATLMPLTGFLLLVLGETIRSLRYARLKMRLAQASGNALPPLPGSVRTPLRQLILSQSFAWCAFVSMLVFSIVLVDRVADYLFPGTMLVAVATRSRLR